MDLLGKLRDTTEEQSHTAVVVHDDRIEQKQIPKKHTDEFLVEGHYGDFDLYLAGDPTPKKIDADTGELEELEDNGRWTGVGQVLTSDYYKTFMQQRSLRQATARGGLSSDKAMTLLYANIIAVAFVGMMILVGLYA